MSLLHITTRVAVCVIPIGMSTNEKTYKGILQLVYAYHILLQFKLLTTYVFIDPKQKKTFRICAGLITFKNISFLLNHLEGSIMFEELSDWF